MNEYCICVGVWSSAHEGIGLGIVSVSRSYRFRALKYITVDKYSSLTGWGHEIDFKLLAKKKSTMYK